MNVLPLQFLMLIFAGWVNRYQQDMIEYLQEENQTLREQLGGKRLRLTDQQRPEQRLHHADVDASDLALERDPLLPAIDIRR